MPIHVKALQPETALRDLIDSSLKSNINGIPFLSVKRRQLLGSKFFHFILSYDDILISLFTSHQPVKGISADSVTVVEGTFGKIPLNLPCLPAGRLLKKETLDFPLRKREGVEK